MSCEEKREKRLVKIKLTELDKSIFFSYKYKQRMGKF